VVHRTARGTASHPIAIPHPRPDQRDDINP